MINHKNKTDDFLKDLLQKADLESPSHDFTSNVMHRINNFSSAPSLSQKMRYYFKSWYFLVLTGMGAIIYAFFYFLERDNKFFPGDLDPLVFPIFKNIIQSLSGLFKSMEISSFTVVIILAIAGLFIIDRLINKFKADKQSYFSF